MKILLINPYSPHLMLRDEWREFELVTAPLGLCYIASYLKQSDLDVEILDCHAQKIALDETIRKVILARPDLTGLTCTTPSFSVVKEIAKAIKEKVGDIPIVVGGNHPTALPEETLRNSCFDYVVRGEGEAAMLDLTKYLKGGIDIEDISGLSYKKKW